MKAFLFVLLLSPILCLAQSFEGVITYTNSYKSKSPQLKSEQLNSMMGTTQIYYIKGGNYKSVFNGSYIKMQFYNNAENRSYSLTAKSDSLYWEDYGKNKDVAIKYEVEKNKETVMGLVCDMIIVYTAKSKTTYYYNKKYPINLEMYKKHQYGNWYYTISKTKALPLKTVYEDEQLVLTSTAVKISPQKLEDNVFTIPDKDKVAPASW